MSGIGTGLPLIMTATGPQPTPPATLRQQLLASVAAIVPGYTADLPGSLIEDISSTDVGAMIIADGARVETVNSLDPRGSNPFLTNQLGQIYGVTVGLQTNTSLFAVFSAAGSPGFVIGKGFTISDGSFQYTATDGGVIDSTGTSGPLFFVATVQGSWAVPANTVTQIVTSVPSTISVTVTNPLAGVPGLATGETEESYKSRVLQAGLAASEGMTRYMKTLLGNVPGVQKRLVSARLITGVGWEVICGGGDPYLVGNAIFQALFDIPSLVGSTIGITAITNANPGVVTTNLNHGLITGQANVHIAGVLGMTGANGGPYTVTVVDQKTFSFGVNTSAFGAYTSGGVVTPNPRNIVVSINDYPDTYNIPFVNPPQQSVTMTVTWNTSAVNFVSAVAVAQLANPALVAYVNSVAVGLPLNILEMNAVFQNAIASVLDPNLLIRLVWAVSINGVSTSPPGGESVIFGDPESYFFAQSSGIVINQG